MPIEAPTSSRQPHPRGTARRRRRTWPRSTASPASASTGSSPRRGSPREPSTSTSRTARRSSTRSTPASTPGSRRRSARRSRDCAPGRRSTLRGVEAYLDTCLADRAVKALALEARSDPRSRGLDVGAPRALRGLGRAELQGDGLARRNRRLPSARGDDRGDRDPRVRGGPPPAGRTSHAAALPRR